jgi:hypothetical protein
MVFHFRCVTFALMKKRNKFLSLFLGTIVLAALLLQSIHAIHHIDESFKEKKCHHIYAKNKTEITHSHHNFEHCFVCEFTFSNSITTNFSSFQHEKITFLTSYSYSHSKEITQFFKGSLFALRAPPKFIV